MAVKLDITANVKGQSEINKLQSGLNKLGTNATIASKRLKGLEVSAAKSRATFAALGTTLKVGVAVGLAAVTVGIAKFVKDTFAAGQLTESLQVRFKLLFNSATEGAKAFEVMNKFASKVPFSLEAIAAGSGNLAVISKDAGELNKILEVTGNVAAATGLDFRQTAEQIQRAFAGGIAAADVFRERGVRAMLGFEAGAKVSIEETRKKFFEVFGNGGQFSTATKEFETTLEAQVSFVQDAYFRFRQAAAEPLFAGVKEQLVELVGDFKKNDTQLKILAARIGKSLSNGFKNLGDFIKTVVENFDNLVKAIKIFLTLKVTGFVQGIISQLVLLRGATLGATGAFHALSLAMRANPIGVVITVLQGLVIGFIIFEDKIKEIVKGALKNFDENLKKIKINFLKFKNLLNIGDEDINLAAIQILEAEIRGLANVWDKATEAKFSYLNGDSNRFADNTAAIKKSIEAQNKAFAENRRQQVKNVRDRVKKSQQLELEESMKTKFRMTKGIMLPENIGGSEDAAKKIKDLAAIDQRITTMNRDYARDQGALNAAQTTYGSLLKSAGIEASSIANTISTTWIDGLRQGNSLLQNVKNTFKNVLNTIAETIIKKGIELQIEKLFEFLGTKKLVVEKQITAEKAQQLALATATAAVSGSGGSFFSAFSGAFGMNKGGMVPGGAPYTDRVPAMLTPGEVVIPRGQVGQQGSVTNNTINISGNVDQRAIDQIRSVISSSPSHVGGANKTFSRNTSGLSMRRK